MTIALMFDILEGGVSEPIKWGKENLGPNRCIIVLDETSLSLFLWHGARQGLVARRTALRQAESLKGHGYTIGKSIIGRDIKIIKEIDSRKIGRVPETTELNNEFEELLNRDYKELEDFVVTFDLSGDGKSPIIKPKTTKPAETAKPQAKTTTSAASKPATTAKTAKPARLPKPQVKPGLADKNIIKSAKTGFVFVSLTEHFDDLWISKKGDGSISVEMMDGPICQFKIDGSEIIFTANSFSGAHAKIKNQFLKKVEELSNLL